VNENSQKKYISRTSDSDISAFFENSAPFKNVLLVEGARQVGKSSLVEHSLDKVSKKATRLNLERASQVSQGSVINY
jgi:predicted AAA+ superfamily ATPase